MPNELKPCPFCGEQPELFDRPCYYYRCVKEKCQAQEVSWNNTIEEAIMSWNHRPLESALQARIAELEKPILCAKCNDHIEVGEQGAICEVCASTQESAITELQEEVAELRKNAVEWEEIHSLSEIDADRLYLFDNVNGKWFVAYLPEPPREGE